MSEAKDDRLDDFREAQETDYEPAPVIHDPDDVPVIDDDDDIVGLDDERVVPIDPEDTDDESAV